MLVYHTCLVVWLIQSRSRKIIGEKKKTQEKGKEKMVCLRDDGCGSCGDRSNSVTSHVHERQEQELTIYTSALATTSS